MTIEEITARLGEIRSRLVELDTAAAGEDLADEARSEWTKLETEADELVERHAALEARAATVRKLAEIPTAKVSGDSHRTAPNVQRDAGDPFDLSEVRTFGRSPREVGKELRDRAMRVIERTKFVKDEHRERAVELLERNDTRDGALARHMIATGSDAYRDAWSKKMVGETDFSDEERQALTTERAMSLTSANGGYAVPFILDPTIILTNSGTINPLRQISRVRTTVASNWHGITSAGVTASFSAEAAQVADGAPTLAQPTINPEKAQAFVPASIEAFEDIAGLADEVLMMFADARDRLEATKFTLGAGHASQEPNGLITALVAAGGSTVVATTTGDVFALADVYKLQGSLPARHRKNASWGAQLAIYNAARQFATANNYNGFWTDLGGDRPAELMGKPAYELEDMDGVIDGSANNYILVYGDFQKFQIVDRVGMSVEFIPHLFGANGRPTGQRGWYAYWRTSSDALDTNAFRLLNA